MTRDEIIAHIQEANAATEPEYPRYERSIEPSDEDAQAIMHTFREWQACGWDRQGFGFAYEMEFETPWFVANNLPLFYPRDGQSGVERPVSDEKIEAYVDVLLNPEPLASPQAAAGTPTSGPGKEQVERLPIPDDAIPVTQQGGGAFPTIFAEHIEIIGPDTASASVYFINEKTGEVSADAPSITYGFVKVDGQWLIDSYRENIGG